MARKKSRGPINGKKASAPKPRRVKSLLKFLNAYGRGELGREQRERFAKRTGTALQYLQQIGYGFRHASPQMAAMIEKQTHGLVTAEELRPDVDWAFLRHTAPVINNAAR
jgi:DNA-binding transcriptional regulator YdaS (Cro superfamily)